MADSIVVKSSAAQIQSNYEKYKEFFAKEDKNNLGQADFLKLMTEQMKNQDFMNPTDNSQYIAQMAQFNSLQQMQQMSYSANATYATSLVGKVVTMANIDGTGTSNKVTDVVTAVKFNGQDFEVIVGGKPFTTKNLVEVLSEKPKATTNDTTKNSTDTTKTT